MQGLPSGEDFHWPISCQKRCVGSDRQFQLGNPSPESDHTLSIMLKLQRASGINDSEGSFVKRVRIEVPQQRNQ